MAVNYTQLNTELTADPRSYGYSALVSAGNDQGLANMLNLRRSGNDPPRSPITVFRESITKEDFWAEVVSSEYEALTQIQVSRLQALVASVSIIRPTDANVRAIVGGLFANGTTTRSNLQAFSQRNGSRAEELFGSGTVIGAGDIALAFGRG